MEYLADTVVGVPILTGDRIIARSKHVKTIW